MKAQTACFLAILIALLSISSFAQQKNREREILLMDSGWKFNFGHASEPSKDFLFGYRKPFAKSGEPIGAYSNSFNDSLWRSIDLPHDWSVELGFVKDKNEDIKNHGYKPVGRDYPSTSIGWYRKKFYIPEDDEGKRIIIKFDGVYRDCLVFVNGFYIDRNFSGYTEFSYDISDYLFYGKQNVVVVRVDASIPEGWFYEGAGIYRHVWLIKTSPLHIPLYGTYIKTEVKDGKSEINVETTLFNQQNKRSDFRIEYTLLNSEGKKVLSGKMKGSLNPYEKKEFAKEFSLPDPVLWSLENPHLYKLETAVFSDNLLIDNTVTNFGIRTILFDKDKGFLLNGKQVKIKGACNHQDHAGVGSALPDRLQYYRIEKLKEMGVNAYRSSHNPPANELLDACDKLGMLVIDEHRLMVNSPEFLKQWETLILRDRNHPSIILWSLGNEEGGLQGDETKEIGFKVAAEMVRRLKMLDAGRPSTYGCNGGNMYENTINMAVDVRGFNYMNISDIDKYRKDYPDQLLIGTEEGSTLCTRGAYEDNEYLSQMSDYDKAAPGWGARAEEWWSFFEEREWLAGAFVWTGFDYRGEPTPYEWPAISSQFGVMDVCGFPKNNYYYFKSWWTNENVLHLFPHWNWGGKEGELIDVRVHTNCSEVELFLNGKSLGKKNVVKNSHLEWKVPFNPGTLKAVGMRNGKIIETSRITSGSLYSLRIEPDRTTVFADGADVSIVNITALDKEGNEVPNADNNLQFSLSGPGKIIGVGNGNPGSHEQDVFLNNKWYRRLFNGKCQVIIKTARQEGEICLTVKSEEIKNINTIIKSVKGAEIKRVD